MHQVGVTVYRVRSQEPSALAGKRQRVSDSPFENLELILQVPRGEGVGSSDGRSSPVTLQSNEQ